VDLWAVTPFDLRWQTPTEAAAKSFSQIDIPVSIKKPVLSHRKLRLSFFSHTYRHPVTTVILPLLTISLHQVRISIWKIVIGGMTSEVAENTGESSFGEAQDFTSQDGQRDSFWTP
jgi:hypothetical protein